MFYVTNYYDATAALYKLIMRLGLTHQLPVLELRFEDALCIEVDSKREQRPPSCGHRSACCLYPDATTSIPRGVAPYSLKSTRQEPLVYRFAPDPAF